MCATRNKSRECVPRKHWNSFIDNVSNMIHCGRCGLEILVNIDVYRANSSVLRYRHYEAECSWIFTACGIRYRIISRRWNFAMCNICIATRRIKKTTSHWGRHRRGMHSSRTTTAYFAGVETYGLPEKSRMHACWLRFSRMGVILGAVISN